MITLPDLPYGHDALEPHISRETMDFHYKKHHKGYVDNLNKLIKDTEFEDMDLEHIIKSATGPIYNNAAQVWNHTFFWRCMTPNAKPIDPNSRIGKTIDLHFGNFDVFKEKFIESALTLFGSGWVWLVNDGGKLKIKQMKNADEPLSNKMDPILVCDIWEHAYYLDYQNNRAEFIKQFFNLINWDFVTRKLEAS